MNVLVLYSLDGCFVESIDVAGMQKSRLLATLTRNDNLADDVSLVADCGLARHWKNGHTKYECPAPQLCSVSRGRSHYRHPGQRPAMNLGLIFASSSACFGYTIIQMLFKC